MIERVERVLRGFFKTLSVQKALFAERVSALVRGLRGFSRAYTYEFSVPCSCRRSVEAAARPVLENIYRGQKPSQPSHFFDRALIAKYYSFDHTLSKLSQTLSNPLKRQFGFLSSFVDKSSGAELGVRKRTCSGSTRSSGAVFRLVPVAGPSRPGVLCARAAARKRSSKTGLKIRLTRLTPAVDGLSPADRMRQP
jgi:hypothetical protein